MGVCRDLMGFDGGTKGYHRFESLFGVAWFDGDILEFRMEKYGMYEG